METDSNKKEKLLRGLFGTKIFKLRSGDLAKVRSVHILSGEESLIAALYAISYFFSRSCAAYQWRNIEALFIDEEFLNDEVTNSIGIIANC
ncbi:hypothetical protein [Liquorilactobacillus oeni]|uniref:Uncharacterized protein n=1 Tax=Liquorilactobacillus oeni DSM 19972 TaxID=1423777 RepID=A0A0R1M753_9LACO|nr:hypothetical protein [Liquorilactobacillus oeni]KRL04007.1 hypothetical protein FD46_GL000009 [Liquorilactobacillus oeni DSM 19972]